jgi:hypothetical protein
MKPIVLTHSFQDGSLTESEPIIMAWNGVEMPKVLRNVKPGQYVLLPYEAPKRSTSAAGSPRSAFKS